MSAAPAASTSTAEQLVAGQAQLWHKCLTHPFVLATAEDSLPPGAFDRWLLADHHFVVQFRRFLAGVLAQAPDEPARDVLAGGITALTPELALFREQLAERGLAPHTYRPTGAALAYTSFLLASLADGYGVAAAVLYGVEKAYFDAWTAVRERAALTSSPYRGFIDNWSAPAFGAYADDLGALLGQGAPTPQQEQAFAQVVSFELAFWDEVHTG
ncbi:transcriptional regulator [Rhodococcus sp. X156]|uniref:transcriptional regulator n=1 Tax=Rhodococcus sp. X156 TaxID=2499145 RepID=UPI000FDC50CC|nr:transcriptional regulator [Rhodococcus sp. X156]